MAILLVENDDKIWTIWEICQQVYLRHGIKLQFPKNTDPKKTYQWRYLNSISKKFDEWEFDIEAIKKFIDIAVAHAKKVGLLKKGLSALHQKNLMELCYRTLIQEESDGQNQIESLRVCKTWLDLQIRDANPLNELLYRAEYDALPNIVLWHQANKLPPLFIALSKSCYKAVRMLQDSDEAVLLPTLNDLYWLRDEFVEDTNNVNKARNILKNDLR